MTLTERTKEDALLIVAMAMIAYGLWDTARLIFVFGGVFVFFLILWAGGKDGTEGTEGTTGRPEETTGGVPD